MQLFIFSYVRDEKLVMANSILVIGSVLLDIVGTYKDSQKDLINKTGNLNFSVGGVAFNIASNLSSKEKPTAIWTCLKKDSISSKVIEDTLKTSRIRDYIHHVDWIKETGYVAHFCDKELKTGITSSEIEFINYGKIKSLYPFYQTGYRNSFLNVFLCVMLEML